LIQSTKNSKNKLSLKVQIPSSNKIQSPVNEKHMFYIPDTTHCTDELNVNDKSPTKSPTENDTNF